MRRRVRLSILIVLAGFPALALAAPAQPGDLAFLADGWAIQSSKVVPEDGVAISAPGYSTTGWYATRVPTTVFAALVDNGVYPDPTVGMALRDVPGMDYPPGFNFRDFDMAEDNPYAVPWWFRTEFDVPADAAGKRVLLGFRGVNYRAGVWLNGQPVTTRDDLAGTYRQFEIDVTDHVAPGAKNALALAVEAPLLTDLAHNFVDWNPMPPDKDMGLWREAYVRVTGPVVLTAPHVLSKLDLPSLAVAHLTVSVDARNATAQPVDATVKGTVGDVTFQQVVTLAAGETRTLVFAPADFPQLDLVNPRVWWPIGLGDHPLYDLSLGADVAGVPSDGATVRFGLREFTSELTADGYRVFKVNGHRILIRGGAWSPDWMFRVDLDRERDEVRMVAHLGLNAIRFEGKLGDEHLLDLFDEGGILVMMGWCCCDYWERWNLWSAGTLDIARESVRSQALRLRNRASVFTWLNGSDNPPPPDVETAYLKVLADTGWDIPIVSSAGNTPTTVSGPSGVKMKGPYEYEPESYWLADTERGGAFGFATEISPGEAIPPVESLKRFLPADHLWPPDDVWNFHGGAGVFAGVDKFTHALEARYGAATGLEDYALKAQMLAYDAHRAMLEGYGQSKYRATGVIQWMLNNAWPSLIWHLYDFYLRAGGSYYGAKKALEPLHVQYGWDDRSIVVVNSTWTDLAGVKVHAEVFDVTMKSLWSKDATVDVPDDGVVKAFQVPAIDGLPTTYFLDLALAQGGSSVSRNFYVLSTKADVLDYTRSDWYYTPVTQHADLTGLNALPQVELHAEWLPGDVQSPEAGAVGLLLANKSKSLAYFVHLAAYDHDGGDEILPTFWTDNDLPLLPGESRYLYADWTVPGGMTGNEAVRIDGWNVKPMVMSLKPPVTPDTTEPVPEPGEGVPESIEGPISDTSEETDVVESSSSGGGGGCANAATPVAPRPAVFLVLLLLALCARPRTSDL